MAKYITTDKKNYNMGEAISLNGDVNVGLLPKYKYTVSFGSAAVEGDLAVASDKDYSDFKNGFEVQITDSFAKYASAYGNGRLCYIKAVGKRNNDTVEYITYIYLKGELEPDFDLTVKAINPETTEFGAMAVKNFSTLQITANNIKMNYGAQVASVRFSGVSFGASPYIEIPGSMGSTEYTARSSLLGTVGIYTILCSVTTNLGYSTTKTVDIEVMGYQPPTLYFGEKDENKPTRIDSEGNILSRANGNKDVLYGIRFSVKVIPCGICRIKSVLGVYLRMVRNQNQFADILGESEFPLDSEWSYEGTPVFYEDGSELQQGIMIYEAADLVVTVEDSSGNTYVLTKRINTMGTTFHLKKGGRGVKFGGYATKDDLVDSAWDIHSDGSIEADEAVKGKSFRISGTLAFESDGAEYNGVGAEDGKIAAGNHVHGSINTLGQLCDSEGNPVKKNLILITDENGYIVGAEYITTEQLVMATDASVMQPSSSSPSIGTAEAGMCYADHIHPYSEEWKNDNDYIEFKNSVSELTKLADSL